MPFSPEPTESTVLGTVSVETWTCSNAEATVFFFFLFHWQIYAGFGKIFSYIKKEYGPPVQNIYNFYCQMSHRFNSNPQTADHLRHFQISDKCETHSQSTTVQTVRVRSGRVMINKVFKRERIAKEGIVDNSTPLVNCNNCALYHFLICVTAHTHRGKQSDDVWTYWVRVRLLNTTTGGVHCTTYCDHSVLGGFEVMDLCRAVKHFYGPGFKDMDIFIVL